MKGFTAWPTVTMSSVAAIGRALGHHIAAQHAAGAGAVVDDHRRAGAFGQLLADEPREVVGRAARRERDDDLQGPALGRCRAREQGQRREQRPETCIECGHAVHTCVDSAEPRARIVHKTLLIAHMTHPMQGSGQGPFPTEDLASECRAGTARYRQVRTAVEGREGDDRSSRSQRIRAPRFDWTRRQAPAAMVPSGRSAGGECHVWLRAAGCC